LSGAADPESLLLSVVDDGFFVLLKAVGRAYSYAHCIELTATLVGDVGQAGVAKPTAEQEAMSSRMVSRYNLQKCFGEHSRHEGSSVKY